MLKFRRLIFLLGTLLFAASVSYANPLGSNPGLFLPGSQQSVRSSSDNETEKEKTPEGSKAFMGVQTDTQPGSIDAGVQRKSHNTLYNANRSNVWTGKGGGARLETIPFENLTVFGASLFNGNFSGTYYDERNPEYMIRFGDRVGVRVWGTFNYEQELTVDRLGNIFIPTVGPIRVAGIPNSEVSNVVRSALDRVYSSEYYEAYIDLITSQPMSVFVSGYVNSPGRYAGGVSDSVLFFLDLAGGIDTLRGSFRDIQVLREGKVILTTDLYKFVMDGELNTTRLKDGDVIVVKKRGIRVGVNGRVRSQAWFEFTEDTVTGDEVMKWVDPMPGVTHVSLWGYRGGAPLRLYMALEEFKTFQVNDSDTIEFANDEPAEAISVYAEGALDGRSQFFVKKGTRLHDVLNYIKVDRHYAKLNSIYLRRDEVAKRQAAALQESLFRLEQNALTSSSATVDEAAIRVKEAELISKFVERAKKIEPQGVVAIAHDGEVENVYLQDGDIIVVPNQSDVVLITGEVVVPNAVVYSDTYTVADYISLSGGLGNKADEDNIILFKADGRIMNANLDPIEAGDAIMVLPAYETKSLQLMKDLTQIFFQIAVGTRAILTPIF